MADSRMDLTSGRQSAHTYSYTSSADRTVMDRSPSVEDSNDENSPNIIQPDGSNKRKKTSAKSCERCKARKVKCDRNFPACGWCDRNSEPCIYEKRRKGHGLRAAQEHTLEMKINRVEAMLQVLGHRVEGHIDSDPRSEPSRLGLQPLNGSFQLSLPGSDSIDVGSLFSPSLESSLDVDPYQQVQYQQPYGATVRVGTLSPEDSARLQHPDSYSTSAGSRWTSTILDPGLPPYELLYSLVDLYFKHVNTWCPILDRNTTFEMLQAPSIREEADCVLIHAIVAISLRFSKDPSMTLESRKKYHNVSKQRVQLYGLEHLNVRALQALVILALDLLGTSDGPQTWYLALIAQKVTQLGLGLEKKFILSSSINPAIGTPQAFQLSRPKSWIEDEERRRLFWMVYVLDRYFTLDTILGFALDDNEIDRQLPCRYDLFSRNQPVETRQFRRAKPSETTIDRPENLGSFSYHCEILRILSRIQNFLNKSLDISSSTEVEQWQNTFRKLDGELDAWLFSLPDEYRKISQSCHSDPNSRISNWIVLHAAYITTAIRLHSAAAYPSVHSHIFKPSYNAMQKCLAAVMSLKETALGVINGMLDLLGPAFAFSLWVAAKVLLVHASIMDHELDPNIGFFIWALDQMGQYWDVAKKYTEVLNRVVREYQPNKQVGREADVGASSTGQTFALMRSRAFELNLVRSQQRNSVLDPISAIMAAPNELENLAVFDFFNYPHLRTNFGSTPNVTDLMEIAENFVLVDGLLTTYYATPDPESDWFTFAPAQE